jgi:hypothetical protein
MDSEGAVGHSIDSLKGLVGGGDDSRARRRRDDWSEECEILEIKIFGIDGVM